MKNQKDYEPRLENDEKTECLVLLIIYQPKARCQAMRTFIGLIISLRNGFGYPTLMLER